MSVVTDLFCQSVCSIPLRTTTATVVAHVFLDHLVYAYGAPAYVLTNNGRQFVPKFFDVICTRRGVKHHLTTAYYPQTSGQTGQLNKTIVQRLCHYVEKHQRDRDIYLQPLTYA